MSIYQFGIELRHVCEGHFLSGTKFESPDLSYVVASSFVDARDSFAFEQRRSHESNFRSLPLNFSLTARLRSKNLSAHGYDVMIGSDNNTMPKFLGEKVKKSDIWLKIYARFERCATATMIYEGLSC